MQTFSNNFNPFAQNHTIVKSYFKKPVILVQGILYLCSLILNIGSVLFLSPFLDDFLSTFFSMAQVTEGMTHSEAEFFTKFMAVYPDAVMYGSLIPSVILLSLAGLAYLIIYKNSKNADETKSPKAGVKILHVLSIIQLIPIILLCTLLAIVVILVIVLAIFGNSYGAMDGLWVIAVLYAIIFGATISLFLLYFINQVRYYKSILNSLNTVNLTYKGAGIFGVMSIIYGAYTCVNALSSFAVAPLMKSIASLEPELEKFYEMFSAMTPVFILSSVASLLSATIVIISGIIAIGYKRHIRSYTEGYSGGASDPNVAPAYMEAVVPLSQPVTPVQPQPVAPTQMPTQEKLSVDNTPQFEPVIFSDGLGLAEKPHCPRCGTPSKDGDVFCSACGTKL